MLFLYLANANNIISKSKNIKKTAIMGRKLNKKDNFRPTIDNS